MAQQRAEQHQTRERIGSDAARLKPCYWIAADPATLTTLAGLKAATLRSARVLIIKKSSSTGWPAAMCHCWLERLNSMVSGKPAATTRKRFLPLARTTAATMIPTGNLSSKYKTSRPPWGKSSMSVNCGTLQCWPSLWSESTGTAVCNLLTVMQPVRVYGELPAGASPPHAGVSPDIDAGEFERVP